MLQNLLRRRVLERIQSSGETPVSVDDTEVIRWRHKEGRGKERQRITSCPDPARLQQLHTHNINMLDLRTICEQGEQFLTDQNSPHQPGYLHGYEPGEVFSTDSETDKENEETFNSFIENDNTRSETWSAITKDCTI